MRAKGLDQYYTRPACARECLRLLGGVLWARQQHTIGLEPGNLLFLEPAAGSGHFLDALPNVTWWAGDVDPQHPKIQHHDFLAGPLPKKAARVAAKRRVVVGNPPFGYKGGLAIDFVNQSLAVAPIVGFVLPVQFRKWSAQSRVDPSARLVVDHLLPEDAFTFLGKPYKLRCTFQVWVRDRVELGELYPDLRRRQAPAINHPDFQAWQYNRTQEAERFFDENWDFAVLRQGYGDFSKIHWKHSSHLDRKQQWIFIKGSTPEITQALASIDYKALSLKNAGTPGFGKADLVEAYLEMLE